MGDVGFSMDEGWVIIGLSLLYATGSTTNFMQAAYALNQEAWTKTSNTMFAVSPYFRYYFAQAGKFNFFCEAAKSTIV